RGPPARRGHGGCRSGPRTLRRWLGSPRAGRRAAAAGRWRGGRVRRSSRRPRRRARRTAGARATGRGAPRRSGRSRRLPGEERRSVFWDVALRPQALALGAEAAQLLLEGRELAVPGEGLIALGFQGLLPGAGPGLVGAEGA